MTGHRPTTPPLRFVAHAGAGRGAFARRWPPIAAALAARGLEHTVELTTRPGEATDLARRAADEGARLVVAVGGDGTLHEVANGLLGSSHAGGSREHAAGDEHGVDARAAADGGAGNAGPRNAGSRADRAMPLVGLVSAGRGSDYARGTGMPVDAAILVDRFARALEGDTSVVHAVDAGEVRYRPTHWTGGRAVDGPASELTSRWFVNAAGIGISPFIAQRVSRFPARLGAYLYTVAGLVTIVDWRDRLVELGWDDRTRDEVRIESVEVALGPYEGGGMWVAPAADPSDGLFDVVIVGAMSRLETLTFTWRIRTGDHLRSPAVSVRRTRSLTIRALDEMGAIYLQADGELLGRDPFSFDIAHAALRLVW